MLSLLRKKSSWKLCTMLLHNLLASNMNNKLDWILIFPSLFLMTHTQCQNTLCAKTCYVQHSKYPCVYCQSSHSLLKSKMKLRVHDWYFEGIWEDIVIVAASTNIFIHKLYWKDCYFIYQLNITYKPNKNV